MVATMETLDLNSLITPDFWFQQFGNLDGVHTGVPTLTTPTLTPSTLRNIAERLFEFEETERPEPHHNEAGFVPPLVEPIALGKNSFLNLVDSKAWIGGSTTITPTPPTMMGTPLMVSMANHYMPSTSLPQQPTRRNVGGRRPSKKNGISPEEEERLQVRRERNKMAAARCRKRRSDHTNDLTMETEDLEKKRKQLQDEINSISQEKEQLEFLLEAHRAHCRLNGGMPRGSSPPDLKPILYQNESRVITQQLPRADSTSLVSQPLPPRKPHIGATASGMKRSRPSSLPVGAMEIAGVPITTPSTVIPFNFESLMDGGTGLTPVSSTGLSPMIPSCSSQQRNGMDLASPDSSFPSKLVSL